MMMYNEQGKRRNVMISLALSILLIVICVDGMAGGMGIPCVYGAQKRTVRVGFFPMEGYNEKN